MLRSTSLVVGAIKQCRINATYLSDNLYKASNTLVTGIHTSCFHQIHKQVLPSCIHLSPVSLLHMMSPLAVSNTHIAHRKWSSTSHYEKWSDLSYEDLVALLESHDIQLFDVRELKEIASSGKIPGSVNIPLGEVKEALQLTDPDFYLRYKVSKPQKHDTNIVFYGLGPIKSSAALELAHKFEYKKARHYSGGFEEWAKLNETWAKH